MKRVFYLNEIHDLILNLKQERRSIALTNGCFDILHLGHLRYLEESKKLADILIVGVNADASVKKLKGESRPINSELERAELLAALRPVDYVIIFSELDANNLLKTVKPNFYTKGGDYSPEDLKNWPEYNTALELGCKIVLVDFVQGKSSTKILGKINS